MRVSQTPLDPLLADRLASTCRRRARGLSEELSRLVGRYAPFGRAVCRERAGLELV
jgi:hypothetical protein